MKWHRADVTHNQGLSDPPVCATARGYVYGSTGLAVQYDVNMWQPIQFDRHRWRIIHLPTGLSIGDPFESFKLVKAACEAIAPVTNWNELTKESAAKSGLKPIVDERLELAKQYPKTWRIQLVTRRLLGEDTDET